MSNDKFRAAELEAALRGLMEQYRLEFDTLDGRYHVDNEPCMEAARKALAIVVKVKKRQQVRLLESSSPRDRGGKQGGSHEAD